MKKTRLIFNIVEPSRNRLPDEASYSKLQVVRSKCRSRGALKFAISTKSLLTFCCVLPVGSFPDFPRLLYGGTFDWCRTHARSNNVRRSRWCRPRFSLHVRLFSLCFYCCGKLFSFRVYGGLWSFFVLFDFIVDFFDGNS